MSKVLESGSGIAAIRNRHRVNSDSADDLKADLPSLAVQTTKIANTSTMVSFETIKRSNSALKEYGPNMVAVFGRVPHP